MRKAAMLMLIVVIVMAAMMQPGAALVARPFASPFDSPMVALSVAAVRHERMKFLSVIPITVTPTPTPMLQRAKAATPMSGELWMAAWKLRMLQ